MKKVQFFEITSDHLKLLKNFNVFWNEKAYLGAPSIDPKRPYGNSDVLEDIAVILGWVDGKVIEQLSEEQEDKALKLHKETETALQICLSTQKFETGIYFQESFEPWKNIDLLKNIYNS